MIFMSWLKDEIGLFFLNGLRTLLASIMATIYEMIGKMYGLFLDLATVDLLSSDVINGIYTRVGLLLGLFMLFKLLFSFLQMMVSPDLITDKQRGIGNIVLRVIVVVVLLGSTPAIFQAALKFQNLLLNNSVIEKLILQEVPTAELAQGKGNYLSWNIFNTFYYIEDPENNCEADEDLKYFENEVYKYGTYNLIRNCLYETYDGTYEDAEGNQYGEESVIHVVHLDGWTAIAVGIFVLWILLMYCISLGVRIAQLAFLQLIAPIPIISYLMPTKNNNLQIWFKQCLTTYLDVFIRIAIMSFVMLVIRLIFHDSVLEGYSAWVVLFIILGLLMFAKKAPELLKELFPSSGAASNSFGFGTKGRGAALGTAGGLLAGGAVGFLGGRGAGRLTGLVSGAFKGAKAGLSTQDGQVGKSLSGVVSNQRKRNAQKRQQAADGSTFMGRMKSRAATEFGFATEAEKLRNENKDIDENPIMVQNEKDGKVVDAVKAINDRAESKAKNTARVLEIDDEIQAKFSSLSGVRTAVQMAHNDEIKSIQQRLSTATTELEKNDLQNQLNDINTTIEVEVLNKENEIRSEINSLRGDKESAIEEEKTNYINNNIKTDVTLAKNAAIIHQITGKDVVDEASIKSVKKETEERIYTNAEQVEALKAKKEANEKALKKEEANDKYAGGK